MYACVKAYCNRFRNGIIDLFRLVPHNNFSLETFKGYSNKLRERAPSFRNFWQETTPLLHSPWVSVLLLNYLWGELTPTQVCVGGTDCSSRLTDCSSRLQFGVQFCES